MLKNLKIDIIYYDTPSDFEFEFNLGGCCHSRVLNNKTASPKEMIDCLSKAVNRSRVILIIGKLSGNDGLYSLISKAIGASLTNANAEEYGINDGEDTTIIAGAVPLVSSDGVLAGCIMESGPQSIILLPGAKSLRKDVAENLVFQYITAVSHTPDTETVITNEQASENEEVTENPLEEIKEEVTDIAEPVTEDLEETVASNDSKEAEAITENAVSENEAETIEEAEGDNEVFEAEAITEETQAVEEPEEQTENKVSSDDSFIDIFAEETEKDTEQGADIDDNYIYNSDHGDEIEVAEDSLDEDDEDDEDYDETEKHLSGLDVFIWVIIGLLFIIAALLVYLLVYIPLRNGVNVIEYFNQLLNI
ncbi:MAG: hypothetical protein IJ946_07620 [Clostridia bacterium]|nr:hypothetical protein [Clostridia bacterium]